jgi:hypothetical protein
MSLDYKPGKIHFGSWEIPHVDPVIDTDEGRIHLEHGLSNADTIRAEIGVSAYDAGYLLEDSYRGRFLREILKK